MTTDFQNFLLYENLYQNKNQYEHYKDKEYDFEFFHDFSKYKSLEEQLPKIKEKYEKRIKRLKINIKEPTLFIRYISTELELKYIENNYENIIKMIKSYNKNNDICFIANSDSHSEKLEIFYVDKDPNDVVARQPFHKNIKLYAYLNSFELETKQENLSRYKKKNRKFNRLLKKILNKANKIIEKSQKKYKHFQQY